MLITKYSNGVDLSYYRKEFKGERTFGISLLAVLQEHGFQTMASPDGVQRTHSLPSEFFWEEDSC